MASQAGARINVCLYLAMCWHTRSCTATDGILSNLCTGVAVGWQSPRLHRELEPLDGVVLVYILM